MSNRYLAHFLEATGGAQSSFTADAILSASFSSSFTADAFIVVQFTADAVISKEQSATFSGDATLQKTVTHKVPELVAVASQGGTGSPISQTWPSTEPNDIALLIIKVPSDKTIGTPSNFDDPEHFVDQDTANGNRISVYGRRCDGNESGTLSVPIGGSVGGTRAFRLFIFRGVEPRTATWWESVNWHHVASGTTWDDEGVTSTGDWRLALNIFFNDQNARSTVLSGQSGGTWSEINDSGDPSPVYGFGADAAALVTAGTIDGGTGTWSATSTSFIFGIALLGEAYGFSADAVIGTIGAASFTGDAVLQASQPSSFTADAIITSERSSSLTADAVIETPSAPAPLPYTGIPGSFIARPGNIVPGAFDHAVANATFTADAIITAIQSASFTADAVIAIPTASFTSDAVIQASPSASFTADSVLLRLQSASFTADAAFSVTFVADAVIQAVSSTSFSADAQIVAPPDDVYGAVPDGYEPHLAAPIDDTQTTITVTDPLPDGTELPILVFIDGEWMLVTAVSLDGLTWTVVRGVNTSTATSHSISPILPANTTVSVGGVQVGQHVNFSKTRLSTYSNGKPGTGEIWVRDLSRVQSFTTGAEVIVRHRNVRVWGGYVMRVRRAYMFDAGSGNTATEPRYLVLEVADYNILFERRVYFRKTNPTFMPVRRWANGTDDDVVIGDVISHYLDIGDDHLNFDINHVGTPGLPQISCNPDAPDNFQIGSAGWRWGDVMNAIVSQTGAVYYIDPDKTVRYVDDSTKQSVFGYTGLSDVPSGTTTGYRDFELVHDGSELVNEQFTWGVGQGATAPVLGHESDLDSIAEHGLWQNAELRFDMYCQDTVDLRAQTWLTGSPQNRRGHKDDKVSLRATVFHPYFRVADVLTVENTTFGLDATIPVRGADITFPTPWNIQMVLTISHEIDQPWNMFEFYFPNFNFGFPPFEIPPFDGFQVFPPHDPCEDDASCIETYTRTSLLGNGLGVDEIWGETWPPSTVYETDGDEAKFHKSVVCSASSGGFTPPIALSDILITSPLEYLFLIRGDREQERVLGNTLTYARWQFLLSAQANPGVEFAPYNAEHYGVQLTWGTQAAVSGPDICTDPGVGDRLSLGFKVFPGANPAASVDFDDAADITIQEPMWLRFRMDEDGLHARLWQFGEVEPGVWSTELSGDYSGLPMLYQWYQYSGVRDQNFYVSSYEIVEPCPVVGPCVDADPGEFEESPNDGTVYGRPPVSCTLLDNDNYLCCFGMGFQYSSSEVWADGYRLRLNADYDEHPLEGCIEIHADAMAGPNPFDLGMSVTANFRPWLILDPPPEYEP